MISTPRTTGLRRGIFFSSKFTLWKIYHNICRQTIDFSYTVMFHRKQVIMNHCPFASLVSFCYLRRELLKFECTTPGTINDHLFHPARCPSVTTVSQDHILVAKKQLQLQLTQATKLTMNPTKSKLFLNTHITCVMEKLVHLIFVCTCSNVFVCVWF